MSYQLSESHRISDKQHDQLLSYLTGLCEMSNSIRTSQRAKFESIDREVYGYIVPDEEDERRIVDNELGKGVKPVEEKLPLTLVRIEEALTYLLLVLAPDEGIYNAIARAEKQSVAKAFAALMNEHAEYFGHYQQLGMMLFNGLKYNWGGCFTEWRRVHGNMLENSAAGQLEVVEDQVVQAGNELIASDPYNTMYDVSVNPLKVHRDGEFVAAVDMQRDFWLYRAESAGEIFNVKKAKQFHSEVPDRKFYHVRPNIRYHLNTPTLTNWFDVLSMGRHRPEGQEAFQAEIVTIYVKLFTNKWGLGPADKLQVWRFTFIPNKIILAGELMNNAHGLLPHVITMPNEDGYIWNSKSWAEYLIPLNRFASFQLNAHTQATRRALLNMIFYDSNLFGDLSKQDGVAGKIPVKTSAENVDFRTRIVNISDAPDTQHTLRDMGIMRETMEDVLPTTMQRQVASLDRATQYQAAATVQASSRRNLKIAKTVYLQALVPQNHMQMYNILQYQDEMELITPEGELIEVNPAEFRQEKLQFTISDGLRGIDKLSLIINIKEVLTILVQNQHAAQEFDVPAIINYWTTLLGDNTDFSQFRIKTPFDTLPPDQKQLAFDLLQQAAAQQEGAPNEPAPPV